MKWIYDDQPPAAGFYAVIYAWDTAEGCFTKGAAFDGERWLDTGNEAVLAFAGPFTYLANAESWADANDPEC